MDDKSYTRIASTVTRIGSIPTAWAAKGAFPTLSILHFENLLINGSLPPSWGNEVVPGLTVLELIGLNLSTTLPPNWGSPSSFQLLETLQLSDCNITGESCLPSRYFCALPLQACI